MDTMLYRSPVSGVENRLRSTCIQKMNMFNIGVATGGTGIWAHWALYSVTQNSAKMHQNTSFSHKIRKISGGRLCLWHGEDTPPDTIPRSAFHPTSRSWLRHCSVVTRRRTAISLVTLSCSRNWRRLSESAPPSSDHRRHNCSGFSSSASRRNMPFSRLSSTHPSHSSSHAKAS